MQAKPMTGRYMVEEPVRSPILVDFCSPRDCLTRAPLAVITGVLPISLAASLPYLGCLNAPQCRGTDEKAGF